ncbi:phosphoglyceromutase 1 [Oenococcus oeni]|uniref:2,3-bisphosphoglycerate-dependent phosphoglycerate mutase n=1 Tax=Oenococcus oeni TaxID=1247 RepID=UPI00107902AA|nr:2,3-bisphosphoglycerate-dependent phosphoglycerate mutase [Oenococcus oeni]AVI93596.1 phosphoglycerate mutase [Oenococcus oeni]SYV99489.1 phosphoglyceromutase 1 [Oenococcus oeni]SYW00967.1 phosphoglyceromutase 1 [Oenococcus oeni]SYW18500.1 phosphoglyceromutase 1 [Oenococcus oeni]VDC14009.1 phosphoglyceromutase 1 [Oenococcus oeni]
MSKLVLIRHGESTANRDNIFTGWTDVPLTEKGISQAHVAGKQLAHSGIDFDIVYTSMLQRAIVTSYIILNEINQAWLPIVKSWRLNERHYGALRGLNKAETAQKYGDTQVREWRRSYTTVPPLLGHEESSERYLKLGIKEPLGESAEMSWKRVQPFWEDQIAKQLRSEKNVLLVAHGSSIRVLLKFLDRISDDNFMKVEVGNGEPIIYNFDQQLKVISKSNL